MDDQTPSHPVCPAGEYCIPAGLANELRAKIDELTVRNKQLCASISTIANLPHTCSVTVGPRQCPPCAAHLYAYSRDQAENRADQNDRIEAETTSIHDEFYVDRIATQLSRELSCFNNDPSFWQSRIKGELQHAYDLGKAASKAQHTRLRAVFDAAQALQESLKTAGIR